MAPFEFTAGFRVRSHKVTPFKRGQRRDYLLFFWVLWDFFQIPVSLGKIWLGGDIGEFRLKGVLDSVR